MTTSAEWTPSDNALEAGRLHCGQSIGEHGCEDFDHLPVAVVGPGQLAPHHAPAPLAATPSP